MQRSKSLSELSISDMMTEIKRRNRMILRLQRRRRALANQLKHTDAEIARMGGVTMSVRGLEDGRKRYKNKVTLADAIVKVLSKDKPTRVADIMSGVQRMGYRSASKTFRTIIFQTLAKDKRVKKSGRGLYILRG